MDAYSSGLAEYLHGLFEDYKTNKSDFTKKCTENLNSFKGIDNKEWKIKEGEDWRSRTFIKLIKVKIFAAISMLCDFLLQGGKLPFMLKESEFEDKPGEVEETAVEKMTEKIRDQLEIRKADKETKRKIFSMGLYGMTWSKYDIEEHAQSGYEMVLPEGFDETLLDDPALKGLIRYKSINKTNRIPGHRYTSLWSMFWDMEEEDVQKMHGLFERTLISPYELRQKKDKPHYINSAISGAISQAARDDSSSSEDMSPVEKLVSKRKRNIPDYEYWGRVPRRIAEDFERDFLHRRDKSKKKPKTEPELSNTQNDGDEIEILAEMAGNEVIRFKRRTDKRPYKKATWEECLDETTGIGIADNGEDVQGVYNGTLRSIEDNSRLAGNVIVALKERFLAPGAFDEITPGMRVKVSDECDDAQKAVQQIVIKSMVGDLYPLLNLFDNLMDIVTQVSKQIYGAEVNQEKTAFEANQLNENSLKYFGDIIRGFDNNIIELEIQDIYDYNMQDPGIPQEVKCPCIVHATGFTGFQNKIIKGNALRQILTLIMSDKSGELQSLNDIEKLMAEQYKSYDLDPDEFIKSEEKRQQEMQDKAQIEAKAKAEAEEMIRKKIAMESEAEIAKREHEAELKSKEKEDDFQRDMIKDAVNV